jgi:hypothetical protein
VRPTAPLATPFEATSPWASSSPTAADMVGLEKASAALSCGLVTGPEREIIFRTDRALSVSGGWTIGAAMVFKGYRFKICPEKASHELPRDMDVR